MIEPTDADIGRAVVYESRTPGVPLEDGVITGYHGALVFVRYQSQHPGASGQGTRREDLRWAHKE